MLKAETPRSNVKNTAYGCVHCILGKERELAAEMMRRCSDIKATEVMQTKRQTEKGVTTFQNDVILKSYIFIEAPAEVALFEHLSFDSMISILTYDDGDWRLSGYDANYAEWIFRYHGVVRLSQAHQLGDHIQIVDGPLKDLEGNIVRIDRRNHSGLVALRVGNNTIKIWLGFEIVHTCGEDGKPESAAFTNIGAHTVMSLVSGMFVAL